MSLVICPYCRAPAALMNGRDVVPKFPKLWNNRYWACLPCGANVKAHRDGKPMGRLADGAVRYARGQAHLAIDRLWQNPREAGYKIITDVDLDLARKQMRRRVYLWIADVCQMSEYESHIGMITHIPLLEAIRDMARDMDPATLRERYHAIPQRRYKRAA